MKLALSVVFFICLSASAQDRLDVAASSHYQKNLDREFADPKESPLAPSDLKAFKGLAFFPIDAKYIVRATIVKSDAEQPFEMKTTGDGRPMYAKYGEAHFELDDKSLVLNIYRNIELSKKQGFSDYLFLPFSDLTSGNESYIGGRYIELREQQGNVWTIDFNRAFNPYCAYNHKYSCPVVPLENDLPVAIRAGVKKFHD